MAVSCALAALVAAVAVVAVDAVVDADAAAGAAVVADVAAVKVSGNKEKSLHMQGLFFIALDIRDKLSYIGLK